MRTKIEVNGIRKGFASNGDRLQVVEDVSLTVEDGEFVAIVGPSGCGKTTLMNMVAGFVQPDAGSTSSMECRALSPMPRAFSFRSRVRFSPGLRCSRI